MKLIMELKVLRQSELKNTLALVLGMRPESIKLGPVILALKRQRKRFFIIHTGRHGSMNRDGRRSECFGGRPGSRIPLAMGSRDSESPES